MSMSKASAKSRFIAAIQAAFSVTDTTKLDAFADAVATYVDEIQANATVPAGITVTTPAGPGATSAPGTVS